MPAFIASCTWLFKLMIYKQMNWTGGVVLVRLNTFISLKILLILNPPSPSHCKIFSNYSVTLARNKNVGCKYHNFNEWENKNVPVLRWLCDLWVSKRNWSILSGHSLNWKEVHGVNCTVNKSLTTKIKFYCSIDMSINTCSGKLFSSGNKSYSASSLSSPLSESR